MTNFTKMNLFAEEEEGKRFGQNNYDEINDGIEDYKDNELTVENTVMATQELMDDTYKMATSAYKAVKKAFKPTFLSRYHAKKIHLMEIEETERFVSCLIFSKFRSFD